MTLERTLVIFKPDLIEISDKFNGLQQSIYDTMEFMGLKFIKGKVYRPMSREIAEAHYAEHNGKPFFEELINFITSGKSCAAICEGDDAVARVRTFVLLLRSGPHAASKMHNLMHASDSVEAAEREIELHFGEKSNAG